MSELDQLKQVHEIQGGNGNWDYSEYMWGMYNGLELALATLEKREPDFRSRPERFLCEPDEPKDTLFNRLHKAWGKK